MKEIDLQKKNAELEATNKELVNEIRKLHGIINVLQKDLDFYRSQYHYRPINVSKEQVDEYGVVKKLLTRIVDLNFPVRAIKVLKSYNCYTLGDVVKRSPNEILKMHNCGNTTLKEISSIVKNEGFELGMDVDNIIQKYMQNKSK